MESRKILPFLLGRKDLVGIEIGVDHAQFSYELLTTGLFKNFFCVDDWNDTFYDVVDDKGSPLKLLFNSNIIYESAKNTLKEFNNVSLIRKKSEHAVKDFKDESFDFIYIDSNHTYENVKKDLEIWWPKLKKKGIFCGDDYFDGSHKISYNNIYYNVLFNVKKAVDEFCILQSKTVSLIQEEGRYPNWYIFK